MLSEPVQPQGLFRPFGRLRWPWRVVTVQTPRRAPRVTLNRYPGQAIGVIFRLPDGYVGVRPMPVHYVVSILWGRPDVRAYPVGMTPPLRRESWR